MCEQEDRRRYRAVIVGGIGGGRLPGMGSLGLMGAGGQVTGVFACRTPKTGGMKRDRPEGEGCRRATPRRDCVGGSPTGAACVRAGMKGGA